MAQGDPRIRLLLQVLDEAFTAKGWQGATLSGAVRGLTPRQALWRPGGDPARNCIWDLVLHTAYWKHVVRERVAGGARTPFQRPPRNFPRLPARADAAAWRADVALLKREHDLLRRAVARLSPARLDAPVKRSPWVVAEQIFGVAAHDLYHTGQIQLLKALQRRR
ncbi:MAG TPA: DinB family protein [Gemmatimonadales bacterium]|nr:DinB family protein [Gemmatimonadales bacterium]